MGKSFHRQFCDYAAQLARKSMMQHQHGCVIVHNKQVVSEGTNESFEHFNHQFSMHAEVTALNKIKHKDRRFLSQCTMYVVRIGPPSSNETFKLSKPCLHCMKTIVEMGIGKVYYTTNEKDDHRQLADKPFYQPRTRANPRPYSSSLTASSTESSGTAISDDS